MPAGSARLFKQAPSADDEQQAAQRKEQEDIGQDVHGLLGLEGLAVVIGGEEDLDLALEFLRAREGANLDEADITALVNEEGGGVAGDVEVAQVLARKAHGKAEAVAGLVVGDDVHGVVLIAGDRDELHAVLVGLIDLLHLGELVLAGAAPAGEDVEHDKVLLLEKLGEGGSAAVGERDGEVGHVLAGLDPDAGVCEGGGAQGREQQDRHDHANQFFHDDSFLSVLYS